MFLVKTGLANAVDHSLLGWVGIFKERESTFQEGFKNPKIKRLFALLLSQIIKHSERLLR